MRRAASCWGRARRPGRAKDAVVPAWRLLALASPAGRTISSQRGRGLPTLLAAARWGVRACAVRISTPGGRRPACGLVGEALRALPAAARCGLAHPGPLIKVLQRALWGIGGVCPLYLQGLQLLISARVMAWQTGRGLPIRRRAHSTAQRATAAMNVKQRP